MIRTLGVLGKPTLLLVGLLVAALVLRGGWAQGALAAPAKAGPLAFLAGAAIACALGVPRQVVAFAGGAGFGVVTGCALSLLAMVAGCAADFLWVRLVARSWAARRISGRLARIDGQLRRHPFSATLTLRLLPVGSNVLLNIAAGLSAVAFGPFLLASTLGYVPQAIVFALLGSGVHVDGTAKLALALAGFAAASLLGLWLMRRIRTSQDDHALTPP